MPWLCQKVCWRNSCRWHGFDRQNKNACTKIHRQGFWFCLVQRFFKSTQLCIWKSHLRLCNVGWCRRRYIWRQRKKNSKSETKALWRRRCYGKVRDWLWRKWQTKLFIFSWKNIETWKVFLARVCARSHCSQWKDNFWRFWSLAQKVVFFWPKAKFKNIFDAQKGGWDIWYTQSILFCKRIFLFGQIQKCDKKFEKIFEDAKQVFAKSNWCHVYDCKMFLLFATRPKSTGYVVWNNQKLSAQFRNLVPCRSNIFRPTKIHASNKFLQVCNHHWCRSWMWQFCGYGILLFCSIFATCLPVLSCRWFAKCVRVSSKTQKILSRPQAGFVQPKVLWLNICINKKTFWKICLVTYSKGFLQNWSEWEDLNFRPLEPHSSALPNCATPRQNEGRFVICLDTFVSLLIY